MYFVPNGLYIKTFYLHVMGYTKKNPDETYFQQKFTVTLNNEENTNIITAK